MNLQYTNPLPACQPSYAKEHNDAMDVHFEIHAIASLTGNIPPAQHPACKLGRLEIFFITSGAGTITADLETHSLVAGKIICLFPGQFRTIAPVLGLEGYYLSVSADFLYLSQTYNELMVNSRVSHTACQALAVAIHDELYDEINDLLEKIKKEYDNFYLLRSEVLYGLFGIFTIYLRRKFSVEETSTPAKRDVSLMHSFFSLISKNYRTMKRVTEYAADMCVSASYLNQVIKKESGRSASYHIQQQIVLEAKRQARYSGKIMKEIAGELGFDDVAHFSKFFKNNTGVTFTEFKQFQVL